jgi:hypothetical protein
MKKYYCRPCSTTILRSDNDPNIDCNKCHSPALEITEENWREGVSRNAIWSVYCKQCNWNEDTYMPYHEEFKCEECGHEEFSRKVSQPNIGRFSEKFPYYDRGLGMWLKSIPHRRQVMKEKGLIEAPGDWSVSDMQDKEALKQAKEDKEVLEKLQKDMKESPAFAEYRRRKDDIKFKHKPRS